VVTASNARAKVAEPTPKSRAIEALTPKSGILLTASNARAQVGDPTPTPLTI
jgi:hypothetical protein